MKREEWFENKWYYLRRFGYVAAAGLLLVPIGLFAHQPFLWISAGVLTVPWLACVTLIPIYHWKDRYVGGHNNLWGALLVIETSGWSKIVYWFRHILPDRARNGRYVNVE